MVLYVSFGRNNKQKKKDEIKFLKRGLESFMKPAVHNSHSTWMVHNVRATRCVIMVFITEIFPLLVKNRRNIRQWIKLLVPPSEAWLQCCLLLSAQVADTQLTLHSNICDPSGIYIFVHDIFTAVSPHRATFHNWERPVKQAVLTNSSISEVTIQNSYLQG